MKDLKVLFPVNSPEEIDTCSRVKSKSVYVYYDYFLKHGFDVLDEFIKKATQNKARLFINFKNTISDKELTLVEKLLEFIETKKITGIMVNTFSVLEILKYRKLPYKIIIDSGLDIHNLSGIEFVKLFQDINNVNVSEEVYLKNISFLKKYTGLNFSIDSDNLPWLAKDIVRSKAVDTVVIKGEFADSKELLESVLLVEKIIENPKIYKNKKLPFKTIHPHTYETNHFTGEFLSTKGQDLKFSECIKNFDWRYKQARLKKSFDPANVEIPDVTLRLRSLSQIKKLENYIQKTGFNPIKSIEYGEILNTADLAKGSFNEILDYVKCFCVKNNVNLQLSTPRILIERDFDRVYEYVKQLFDKIPPSSLVVNNIGFWWAVVNDSDYENVPIELGIGCNLFSSKSVSCLASLHDIDAIDLSNFIDIKEAQMCIEEIEPYVKRRKLAISGSVRIPCSGLCPLNTNSAILSRLSCTAPCHKGNYCIDDKTRDKIYTIAADGFCRMHLYRNKILDLYRYVKPLRGLGINEFIIDLSCLDEKLLPIMINRFLNSLVDEKYSPDENFLDKLYYLNYYY